MLALALLIAIVAAVLFYIIAIEFGAHYDERHARIGHDLCEQAPVTMMGELSDMESESERILRECELPRRERRARRYDGAMPWDDGVTRRYVESAEEERVIDEP